VQTPERFGTCFACCGTAQKQETDVEPSVQRMRFGWVATGEGVTAIASTRDDALRACRAAVNDRRGATEITSLEGIRDGLSEAIAEEQAS
jgi:hypothetical protein